MILSEPHTPALTYASTRSLTSDLWLSSAVHATHILEETWRTELTELPAELGQLRVVQRSLTAERVCVYGCLDGADVYLALRRGRLKVRAAGPSPEACRFALEVLRELLPEAICSGTTVPVTIWASAPEGPESYERRLEVPTWPQIAGNYARTAAAQLEELMQLRALSRGGRLIVWSGSPGTGKTWALRALAHEWRDWCELHYVTDPEVFLGAGPAYMLQVTLPSSSEDEDEMCRLIVLEDAGELLCLEPQALGRLLNMTDGILGQGSPTMVLLTTNHDPASLPPALRRPGRCAAEVRFGALEPDRASAWLAQRGKPDCPAVARTLGELYAELDGVAPPPERRPIGFAAGR